MKVIKAIELLNGIHISLITLHDQDYLDAIKLAIQALIRHKDRDYITYAGMQEKLIGETDE